MILKILLLLLINFCFGAKQQQNQSSNKSQRTYIDNLVILWIEEIEVITGALIETTVIKRIKCPECKGTGKGSIELADCKKCNGTGLINGRTCVSCNGKGKKEISTCNRCKGGGSVSDASALMVHVPPGVSDDDEFIFPNYGDEYIDNHKVLGKGKLVIRVKILPNTMGGLFSKGLICS